MARALERLILVGCAPLLLYIGYRLFVLGIAGQIQLAADLKGAVRAKLTNLSPGALCFVLAVAVAIVSFTSPLNVDMSNGKRDTSGPENDRTKIVFEGGRAVGIASDYTLSLDLRSHLGDVLLCQQLQTLVSKDSCYDKTGYNREFQKIPLPDDLKTIQDVESRLSKKPTEDDLHTYADLKRAFLKEQSQ